MKGMSKKKIGGFMCHSPAATAVCMTPDSRSVIVPGRRSTTERNIITNCNNSTFNDQNGRSFNSVKYSKLIDCRRNNNINNNNQSSQTKLITNSISTNNNSTNNGSGGDNNKAQVILRPASMMIKTEQALRKNISSDYNEKQIVKLDDLHKSSSVLDSVPGNVFQVVVLRVSLHCQGCAGKLKKHIAKMEGVTSFSIELEHKRVTVMGHVSPVVVLENISKVRRAEFWPTSVSTDQYHNL